MDFPKYVVAMRFNHLISADDVVTEDGTCTLVSETTANIGLTKVETPLDADTAEPISDRALDDNTAGVVASVDVDCTPGTAHPQPRHTNASVEDDQDTQSPVDEQADVEPTTDTPADPEVTQRPVEETEDDQDASIYTTPGISGGDRVVEVESLAIDSGQPSQQTSWLMVTGCAVIGAGLGVMCRRFIRQWRLR